LSGVSTSPSQLEIVERTDSAAAARLSGDLDIVTSDDVKRELVGLVDAGHTALALDLTDVGFVDSSGLGVLVAIHRHAEAHGGGFVVRSAPPQVRRLFEITRLGDLLTVDGD
jgi:anti-sigma B factor antagonist